MLAACMKIDHWLYSLEHDVCTGCWFHGTAWRAMRAKVVMLACMDSRPCLPVRLLASSATAEMRVWNSALAFAASSTAPLNQCRRLSCCLWPAAHTSAGA